MEWNQKTFITFQQNCVSIATNDIARFSKYTPSPPVTVYLGFINFEYYIQMQLTSEVILYTLWVKITINMQIKLYGTKYNNQLVYFVTGQISIAFWVNLTWEL